MRISKEDHKLISETFDQIANKQQLDEIKAIDAVHLGLDAAGMLPGVGILADLANAGIYTARGQKGMAALSLGAAVPGLGQAVTAGKLATKFGGKVGKAAKAISPTGRTAKSAEKATEAAKKAQQIARGKAGEARRASAAARGSTPTIGPPTNLGAASQLGTQAARRAADASAVARTSRVAAKDAVNVAKVAQKSAARTAKTMKVLNPALKLTTRAGVLARGDVAQTYGFNNPKTPARDVQFGIPFTGGRVPGEGAAAVSNLTSKIWDTLKKGAKGLEGVELGSFQPRKVT